MFLKRCLYTPATSVTVAIGVFIFFLGSTTIKAADPILCPMHNQYFTLLPLPNGKSAAIGASVYLGIYPPHTELAFHGHGSRADILVRGKVKELTPVERKDCPEWLLARENFLQVQANLVGILKLYLPGPSQTMARGWYSDMATTQKAAKTIHTIILQVKAKIGPLLNVEFDTTTKPPQLVPTQYYSFCKTLAGYRVSNTPKRISRFLLAEGAYPYWLPKDKRGSFTPTADYIKLSCHYSSKYPKPDAAIYVRKIKRFEPDILQMVRRIIKIGQSGSDKQIVQLWRPNDRKDVRDNLQSKWRGSDYRYPYQGRKKFWAIPEIQGKDLAYVLVQPIGGHQVLRLRLELIGGMWYESEMSDFSFNSDFIAKDKELIADVLANRSGAVLIKSGGGK